MRAAELLQGREAPAPAGHRLPSCTLGPGEGEGLGREGARQTEGPSLTSSHVAPSLAEMLEATAHMLPPSLLEEKCPDRPCSPSHAGLTGCPQFISSTSGRPWAQPLLGNEHLQGLLAPRL